MSRGEEVLRTQELGVDVAHPVGSSLLLPITLHVQVVQAVTVQLNHLAYIALVHLLIRPTALHHHPHLHTEVKGQRAWQIRSKPNRTEQASSSSWDYRIISLTYRQDS